MRYFVLSCALLLSAAGFAQEKPPLFEQPAPLSWIPHPILFGGPSLVGNGYQDIATNLGTAFLLKSHKMVGDFEASYMNAKKTTMVRLIIAKDMSVSSRGGYFSRGTEGYTSAVEPSGAKLQPRTKRKKRGGPRLARDKITSAMISVAAGRCSTSPRVRITATPCRGRKFSYGFPHRHRRATSSIGRVPDSTSSTRPLPILVTPS